MKEKILYRQPVDNDLQAAFTISADSFSRPWSLEALEGAFGSDDYCSMAAEYNGELIGFSLAQTVLNEAEIVIVVVDKRYRNLGIGYEIISYLEKELVKKGITYLILEVRVSNKAAIELYLKLDFKNIGTRKNFYTHPIEDAYIMTKELGC